MRRPLSALALPTFLLLAALARPAAAAETLDSRIDAMAVGVETKVIAWRRDFHQHPELSNREERTAGIVAEHLRKLGYEVRTGVAHHGVVGVLVGGKPGPVVALRADMDALPVSEEVDLPFASKEQATYNGQEVGVMHACGHDAHTAMLMGAAEVLAGLKSEIPGTIELIFQPAEEGAPAGEDGGAGMMVAEGALDRPKPGAIFGLHVVPMVAAGEISYRAGGQLAGSDRLKIVLTGRQSHAGMPWQGIDPVTLAAQLVLALQTIPSRQVNLLPGPVVLSIGSIHGGVRNNIIPEKVELLGTIRTFDAAVRQDVQQRVRRTAEGLAATVGAKAEVTIDQGNPVTFNDPALTRAMAPTIERVAGKGKVVEALPVTWAEDFAVYQQKVPGLFLFLGIRPPGVKVEDAAPNHSPRFFVDESALKLGVRTLTHLAVDYLSQAPAGGH